jgi:malonyl-CoA O-methyltransferase
MQAQRRARARAVVHGGGPSVLAAEVASRMDERLSLMKIVPHRVLDAGGGADSAAALLRARYPRCQIIAVDDVPAGLKKMRAEYASAGPVTRLLAALGVVQDQTPVPAAADLASLPLADDSVGLVWSNLALQRYADPLPVLRDMHRVLGEEGLLMFTAFGPDTLKELRAAFAKADPGHAHVHDFVDMHDLGDMLVAGGFSAPVMDMETITLTYADVTALARDLRAMGAANALQSRRRGLGARGMWDRLRAASALQHLQGRLPASFEIVYGHAWKPKPRPAPDAPQVVKFHPAAGLRPKPD